MTPVLRILAVVGAALAALIGLAPAVSASAERIIDFTVDARVMADGSLQIDETIEYDFGAEERHGIFRTIPVYSGLPDGSRWMHPATLTSISMNGNPVPYTQGEDGAFLEVRIGDPDVLITGIHTYEISYVIDGALRALTAEDIARENPYGLSPGDVELYWDFVGTGWDVPIDRVMVDVVGPGPVVATECFAGLAGSAAGCSHRVIDDRAIYRILELLPYEGLTGVAAFPGTSFTVAPAMTIVETPVTDDPGQLIRVSGPIALAALILPAVVTLFLRRRLRGASVKRSPVRFGPPGDLRPAEIAVGLDGDLEPRAVVATLLDLVARRYITLTSNDGGFLSKGSITLAWTGQGTDPLRPWEERMLAALFEGRTEAVISGYDPDFATAVSGVEESLSQEAIRAQRLDPESRSTKRKVGCASSVAFAVAVASFMAGAFLGSMLLLVGLAPVLFALGIGLAVASLFVPQRESVESARFESEVEGFRRFLDTDPAEARRELVQRLGLPAHAVYATFLPYAVVFDLEGGWSGAFPELTEQQLHSTGLFLANTAVLSRALSTASGTVRSAYTAPSSSGGSGFGGGSSGGGGGGGGGGSW